MRYKIKKIEDKEINSDTIIIFVLVMAYLLCFVLSKMFADYNFSEWLFFQYKKLPK